MSEPQMKNTISRATTGKRLRVFGPSNCPDNADCYYGDVGGDLGGLIEQLQHYLPQMDESEEFTIRVKAMTDAEVEALPDL